MNPKLFLSYCWKNSNEADIIFTHFEKIGVSITRDKRDLLPGISIPEFMNSVSEHHFMIMLVSEDYLKSVNCMLECIELFNVRQFGTKVIPVLLKGTQLFSGEDHIHYCNYWKAEKETTEKNHLSYPTHDSLNRKDKVADVESKFSRMLTTLIAMHMILLEEMIQTGYNPILKRIGLDEQELDGKLTEILNIKDLAERQIAMEKFLLNAPKSKHGLFLHASILRESGQYERSAAVYQKLIENFPDYLEGHNDYGLLLMDHMNRFKDAEFHFKKAIEIDQDDSKAYNNLGLLYADHLAQYDLAKSYYAIAIEKNPSSDSAFNNMGLLLADHFPDSAKQAEASYRKAIEINPGSFEAYANLGAFYMENSPNIGEAKKYFTRAKELDPQNASIYVNLAKIEIEYNRDFNEGRRLLNESINLNPGLVQAHMHMAKLLKDEFHEYADALHHYKKVLALKPNVVELYLEVSELIQTHFADKRGEMDNLRDMIERLKYMYEKDSTLVTLPLAALAYQQLGILYYTVFKDNLKAKENCLKAVQLKPSDDVSFNILGSISYLDDKNYVKASEYFAKALSSNPNRKEAHFMLANIYGFAIPDFEKGYFHYQKAIQLDPEIKIKFTHLTAFYKNRPQKKRFGLFGAR